MSTTTIVILCLIVATVAAVIYLRYTDDGPQ